LSVRARASTPPAPTGAGAERAAGDGADEGTAFGIDFTDTTDVDEATTDCSA
jgi:hypothetical protein